MNNGKFNAQITKEIADRIRKGLPQKDAAVLSGINEVTFYRWMKDHVSFASAVKEALAEYKQKMIDVVHQGAYDNKGKVKSWQAAMTMLERRFREDYSQRFEHTGKDGAALIPIQFIPHAELPTSPSNGHLLPEHTNGQGDNS